LALTRQEKEQMLQEYSDKLQRAQVLIWADYRGTTVPQVQDLRGQLRTVGAEEMVVKNTLMRLALEQAGLPVPSDVMAGPSAVTFVYDDVAAATKVVTGFASANERAFHIKGGMAGGKVIGVEDVTALTTLPSYEVLLARVLGGIQAPISGLVGTLAAVMRGLMNVLNARAEQLEGSPG
jgi:large subunit ribosomal protein L10